MQDILNMMVQLEDDVAMFYQKLATMKHLQRYIELFNYMSLHSQEHSESIKQINVQLTKNPLNKQKYLLFHARLKENLLKNIANENDVEKVGELLGEAEGLMGYAYDQIAESLETNGRIMLDMAKKVHAIAKEEEEHKRQVLVMGQSV